MYFNSETVLAAKLAAVDHYQLAVNIFLDSNARLIDLYSDAGGKVLGLVSVDAAPHPAPFKSVAPDFFIGHLRIAGHVHQDLIRLTEARMHSANSLVRFALDKTALMSPPMVELALDGVESMVNIGESAADELGDASFQAVNAMEETLLPSPTTKKKERA